MPETYEPGEWKPTWKKGYSGRMNLMQGQTLLVNKPGDPEYRTPIGHKNVAWVIKENSYDEYVRTRRNKRLGYIVWVLRHPGAGPMAGERAETIDWAQTQGEAKKLAESYAKAEQEMWFGKPAPATQG